MELRHPWLQGPLRLSPGWTGATLSAQSLRAPAAALSALGSPWNTLAPQGTLELKWQTLPLGGRLPAGPLAELRWRDAATALAPVNPVGSYVLRLQGDGKSGGALALSTESGLLDVSGQGSLSPRGAKFQGARPMPQGGRGRTRGAGRPAVRAGTTVGGCGDVRDGRLSSAAG